MKAYIAGKVSKDSIFGTHYWRDGFCKDLEELSGIKLENLDPTKLDINQNDSDLIFGYDSYLISQSDVVICYLSDDISVGGSQEILIAKYFGIPVIGLAKYGGKFNGANKEHFGKQIKDYKDPFVFTSCDIVCGTINEVADALKAIKDIKPKTLGIIDASIEHYLASKLTDQN